MSSTISFSPDSPHEGNPSKDMHEVWLLRASEAADSAA